MDVEAARAILRYEYDRRPSAAEVLSAFLSEVPPATSHLTWRSLIRIGHVPTNSTFYPYGFSNNHPINLAAEVQAENIDVSRAILERVQRDINNETKELYRNAFTTFGVKDVVKAQIFIQKPIEGLPLLKGFHPHVFRQSHGYWYDPRSIGKDVLEEVWIQGIDMNERLAQLAEWAREDYMKSLALSFLKKNLVKRATPSISHANLAMLVRRCDQEAAAELLSNKKGIYAWLNIALQNPSQKAMTQGLRALGDTTGRYKLMTFLRRPLTVKEVESITGPQAIRIINTMPWEYLAEAVKENPERMRAHALKVCSGNLSELMKFPNCLKYHEARLTAFTEKEPPGIEPARASEETLITTYNAARALRKVLCDTYDPDIAKVILLYLLYKQDRVKEVVEKLMTPDIAIAAAAYNAKLD